MSAFGYNPKKNAALDALRKDEIHLLGFPAFAYGENSKAVEISMEFGRRSAAAGPRADKAAFAREAKERIDAAASEAFGTAQRPFIVSFGADVYAVFIPDSMAEDEVVAFKTSVGLRGLKLAVIVARREANGWSYDLPN